MDERSSIDADASIGGNMDDSDMAIGGQINRTNTGGDLVGRDREPINSNLTAGGDLKKSTVVTGKGNRVSNRRANRSNTQNVFSEGSTGDALMLAITSLSTKFEVSAEASSEFRGEMRQRLVSIEQAIRQHERQIHRLMEMETDIRRDTAERLSETKERIWTEVAAQMRAYQQYAQTRFYALWILVIALAMSVIYLAVRG